MDKTTTTSSSWDAGCGDGHGGEQDQQGEDGVKIFVFEWKPLRDLLSSLVLSSIVDINIFKTREKELKSLVVPVLASGKGGPRLFVEINARIAATHVTVACFMCLSARCSRKDPEVRQ